MQYAIVVAKCWELMQAVWDHNCTILYRLVIYGPLDINYYYSLNQLKIITLTIFSNYFRSNILGAGHWYWHRIQYS